MLKFKIMDDFIKQLAQLLIDGWVTCNFVSFSAVFQSYQGADDSGRLCPVEQASVV